MLTGGVDQVYSRTETAGTHSVVRDGLGSTLALLDSSGTTQTEYTYEPFGNTSSGGAASTNSSQYTGRENDGTGLYYYRARYYSPTLQRFISEDPIGFAGGDLNLYAYVSNSPCNATDPTGEWALVVGCVSGIAFTIIFNWFFGRKTTWWEIGISCAVGAFMSGIAPRIVRGFKAAWKWSPNPKPPPNYPKPPNWKPDWEWRYPEGLAEKGPRWFEPNGAEWRYHFPDKWHPRGHWDYNPWTHASSPWQNIFD
jgi:RHS repeat-associated protein